jgi:hypothetical protein
MKRMHISAVAVSKLIILCSLALLPTPVFKAQQPSSYPKMTNEAANDMARTYSFYMAQAMAIQAFSKKFPELAPDLTRAQARFDMAFKPSVENIDAILTKENPYWASEKPVLLENMRKLIEANTVSLEQARVDVNEFYSRAEGKIPSPFFETLLIYHPAFLRVPSEEFIRGYIRSFESAGHPKSKGVNFKITYPVSWKAKEGERPNVIVKFVGENGRGLESIMIIVKDLPISERQKITEADIQDLFSESTLKILLGSGAKYISSTRIKLEGLPGAMVHYGMEGQRLDVVMQTRNLSFIVLYKNKLIFIDCGVWATKENAQGLDTRFRQLEPLFKLIANSLVVQNRWQ